NVGTTHQFTARQVAPVEAIIGSNNGNQNLTGVTSAELDMDNYDLKLVKQIGSDNGFRIDFGINLEAIEEEIDEESIVNSLYLVGGVPDNDYDEDKEPIEYGYLEIDGVTNENRRIAKRENGDCKTVDELIKWGKTLFDNDRIHEPKATHTVSMVALEHTLEYGEMYQELASLHFGDVAHVRAKELDIEIKERMVEYTYFPTLGKYKDIVLGNDLSLYTSAVNTQAQELKKKIDNRTETLVQNVLNATAWITGNSGGHVVFRPEKAPSEILIMDTPNVANAKRVWRWN
ncbi:TPA: phage tail protein, partial [Enterococcus faecium]|nr:phage tail protein [Enterococcus faecium]